MNIRKRYSKRNAHKLFENEQHVDSRATSSLLDESLWKQADTLIDDADHIGGGTAPDGIQYRNLPQVDENSDRNPKPNSQNTQQETAHGEPDKNLVDRVLNREVTTHPEQGDEYVGRDQLYKNDQPNQQKQYGGGMTEDYMPVRAQMNPFKPMEKLVTKVFSPPVSFDKFVEYVQNKDSITMEEAMQMNPDLLKLLVENKILQLGDYKLDKSRFDAITERMRTVGKDFSKVTLKELAEFIQGTPAGQPAAPAGAGSAPAGGGAGVPNAGGVAPQQQQTQQQAPAQQGDVSAMLEKVGKFKLADIKDKIQVSDKAKQFIDAALAQDPQIDLNAFTSLTPESFQQDQTEEQTAGEGQQDNQVMRQTGQLESDLPQAQMEVLQAAYAIADDLLAEQEKPLELVEPEPLQLAEDQHPWRPNFEQQTEEDNPEEPAAELPAEQPQNQQQPLSEQQQAAITNYLQTLRNLGHDNVPDASQFGSLQEFRNWYYQQPTQPSVSIGRLKALGIVMPKMTVEDVRKLSPKHARNMEAAGIVFVDADLYKKAYKEQMKEVIKTASSATRTAFKMRSNGRSINEVIGLVSYGAKKGKYSQKDADVACVMMHRLAQLTCQNREDISYDDLMVETNSAVERLAAKSEVAIPVYIKTAAKQIRAVDHTLYNIDHGGADKDFNYADPWDVNWTLYRGTEGKKGGKIHTCKSPAMAMSQAKKSGDGNYLIVGESILDDAYWGTYTVKVEKGLVVNYAKIPVDASGKRVAGKQDNTKVVQARRRYAAIYKAVARRKLIAQSDQFYQSPYTDWPMTDEEMDKRYEEALAEDQSREKVRQQVDEWMRRMDRELAKRYPQETAGEFPTQEEADKTFEDLLAANPDVMGKPQTGE